MTKRTPLYEAHKQMGAKIIEFGGWEMPVSYSGIIDEHLAVRNSAGMFDVGHMGITEISGENALPFIQKVATNDASKLVDFKAQYSILCNEKGGVVDDILVYKLPDKYILVLNASNIEKDLEWLNKNIDKNVKINYRKDKCIISLQGPKSELMLSPICDINLTLLKRNQCAEAVVLEKQCMISRTGYTGEDGFELFINASDAAAIWQGIYKQGAVPCGLGARDSLRIEAALPLYGNEYNDEITPIEAGYRWAVKFDKGSFIGKDSLLRPFNKKLVGIELKERAIARHGVKVFLDAEIKNEIGIVTSGTFSPKLNKSICLGYLSDKSPDTNKAVWLNIRNKPYEGKVVALPFYKRDNSN